MVVQGTTLTWLSENDEGFEEVSLGGDSQVLRIENVYEDAGDCERGELLGVVYIEETETGLRDRVIVTATFDLDSGDSLVLRGVVHRKMHNDRPCFEGRLGVEAGTGKFKGRSGQADVDVCNPKRWIILPGP